MTPFYFYILLGSVLIPLLFSVFFIDFIKNWKAFSISTILIAIVFLIWDAIFTKLGIWGFNDSYCLGLKLFEMPIEEWLFFLIIPFCSLFAHFAFCYGLPALRLHKTTTIYLTGLLIVMSVGITFFNLSKAYTSVNFSILTVVLILGLFYGIHLLEQFYISFLIILIPFFIVNGMLTGALTENPIVWYNDLENLGIRLHTIPVEDIGYCFSLLFGNLMIFEYLKKKKKKKKIKTKA